MKNIFLVKDFLLLLFSAGLNYVSFLNSGGFNGFSLGGWLMAIPFLFVLHKQSWRARLLSGLIWGVLTYGLLLWWLAWISPAGYALFVLALALQGVVFAVLVCSTWNFLSRPVIFLFYIPSAWVCSEHMRTVLLGGFSWGIGYSQSLIPEFIQSARFGGMYAVGWLMVFYATAVFLRLQRKKTDFFRDPPSLFLLAFPLIVWIAGALVLALDTPAVERSVRVALIQPAVSYAEKTNVKLYSDNAARHLALSKKSVVTAHPDIIVWPETAFPDDILRDPFWRPRMETVARNFNAYLLIGSALLADDGHDINALLLIDPAGLWKNAYYKRHLVPFTEYLPKDGVSTLLARAAGITPYNFLAGQRAGSMYLERPGITAGVAICSEEGYPGLFRQMARQGAEMWVTTLNDGWFTRTEALILHTRMAVLRAVETGRPLVRAANTGWTGGIDHRGRVIRSAPLQTSGWVQVDITPKTSQTPYTRFGDLFVLCCAGFVIITFMKQLSKKPVLFYVLVFFGSIFTVDDAHAAAVAQRRAQMMKQAQEQQVQQYQQQMMAQQQAQQVAVYQQAQMQQQYQQKAAYEQAARQKAAMEYAVYKQAMEAAVTQKNAGMQAAAQVQQLMVQQQAAAVQQKAQVQQLAEYKNAEQIIAYKQAQEVKMYQEVQKQAQLNGEIRQYAEYMAKRKAVMQAQQVQVAQAITEKQLMEHAAYQKAAAMKHRMELNAAYQQDVMSRRQGKQLAADVMAAKSTLPLQSGNAESDLSETTVGINELWNALELTARSWTQIMDEEIKLLTVSEFIDRFRKAGVVIRRPPGDYVKMIDSLARDNADILNAAFPNVLSYAAIVEYDFQNGKNKDDLARGVLGETAFQANRNRILAR